MTYLTASPGESALQARVIQFEAIIERAAAHEWSTFGDSETHRILSEAQVDPRERPWEYGVFDANGDWWAGADTIDDARHYLAQEPAGSIKKRDPRWYPVEEGQP